MVNGGKGKRGRRSRRLAGAAAAALAAMAALAPSASAAINHEALFRFGSLGSGAGQLNGTRAIASDPRTGHIYVVGEGNNRVDEFTPWGGFVKAYGWDVAPGAVNEVQELRVRAGSGSFKLSFSAASTADLPFNATGAEVKAALEGLSTIGGAGGSVEVVERKGASDGTVPFVYAITFKGTLEGTNVAQLVATNGTTPLGGGVPSTILEARTRADGTPGGTGLESCTEESGCQAGSSGGGAGQMRSIFGAATDASGNLYIRESPETNNRVQKLSPDGHFVWAVGGEVNKTKSEELGSTEAQRNLCTAASGDVCQAGSTGSGKGQFQKSAISLGVAFAAGKLYVADGSRIQVFDEAGAYLGDLPDPGGVRAGKSVTQVAVDAARNRLYLDYRNLDNVTVLDASSGAEVGQRKESFDDRLAEPLGLALDSGGDLFAVAARTSEGQLHRRSAHVAEFTPSGTQLLPDEGEEEACQALEGQGQECGVLFGAPEAGNFLKVIGSGPANDLYVADTGEATSKVRAFGPAPLGFESPPPAPPSIDAQYATSVSDTDASVRAEINPHFWSGSLGTTTFLVQYATAACIDAEGWDGACVAEKPAAPGSVLKGAAVDAEVKAAPIALEGLAPQTEYRYRFVAEGSGAPGVQIVGAGGSEGAEGAEAAFRTFAGAAEEAPEDCPANEAFRSGASAGLPDCRAFEMVSPIDKEGGEIKVLPEGTTETPAALVRSTAEGTKVAYGTYRAFGDAASAPYTSQYVAIREEGGQWRSEGIGPPRTVSIQSPAGMLDTEVKYLSEDLCSEWIRTYADPPLAAGAVPGHSNLYRRELCPEPGGYEALTTVAPPTIEAGSFLPELQGVAGGGGEAVYAANGKLTADAPSTPNITLLYGFRQGDAGPRFLCILPGGAASTEGCTAGGPIPSVLGGNRETRLNDALSADGTKLYWSTGKDLYLRENPFGEGGECSGPEAPCTKTVRAVGKEESARFWGASPEGGTAIYSTSKQNAGTTLFEYDAASETSGKIAGRLRGVAGMSEDAADVYLISEEDLDGGGPAQTGGLNLYLREAAGPSTRFIAALAGKDMLSGKGFGAVGEPAPAGRTSKVSGDGETIAFMSSAAPTGYDNHDLASGEADAEIYLYRAQADGGAGALSCVSCNPAGSRPIGKNIATKASGDTYWAAGSLPVAQNNLYEGNVLTDGGDRLFFNSSDALVRTDTNGISDVYQWEAAGTGGCGEAGTDYVASAEGCIDLISSGQSQIPSEFAEASPSGEDVFFTTLSSLVPQDPGSADLYDARVGGGLPTPPPIPPECEAESCQHPPAAPNFSSPASSTYHGPGNLPPEEAKKPKCPKGKVRKNGHCVKKHHKSKGKQKRHASHRSAAQ